MTISKIALAFLILLSSTFTFASEQQAMETAGAVGLQVILVAMVCRLIYKIKSEYERSIASAA